MLGLEFGTKADRADWLEESLQIIRSQWTQPRTTFEGRHYRLVDAVAEPKPLQQPHPPIWIGGTGPKRTLAMTARYADAWNAPGGSPAEFAASSAILDGHCAAIGRDPAEIRRTIQLGVGEDDLDGLAEVVSGFVAVGVDDVLLIVRAADPVGVAEQVAAVLPRLRRIA
jgi:alkanesulfonate monooxygenase SsuD/methylene tetrahydromethanopterin reductase-like flavin-dependent oxidoreductase (luciferase family)